MNTATKYGQLKDAKRAEKRKHDEDARLFLEEALKAAAVYIRGDSCNLPERTSAHGSMRRSASW